MHALASTINAKIATCSLRLRFAKSDGLTFGRNELECSLHPAKHARSHHSRRALWKDRMLCSQAQSVVLLVLVIFFGLVPAFALVVRARSLPHGLDEVTQAEGAKLHEVIVILNAR